MPARQTKNETLLKKDISGKVKQILSAGFNIPSKHNSKNNYILPCSFNLQETQYLKHKIGAKINYLKQSYNSELEQRLKTRVVNCNAGISSFYIAETGEIAPCFWHKDKVILKDKFTLSSVKKMQIENSNKKLVEKCQNCSINNLCVGGCPFEKATEQFCNSQINDFEKVIIEKNAN